MSRESEFKLVGAVWVFMPLSHWLDVYDFRTLKYDLSKLVELFNRKFCNHISLLLVAGVLRPAQKKGLLLRS